MRMRSHFDGSYRIGCGPLACVNGSVTTRLRGVYGGAGTTVRSV
jgi:hypothetical protein